MKTALIFGITGQSGSYLAEYLLKLGYCVHGVIRRSSTFNTGRLDPIWNIIKDNLHYGDVIDPISTMQIINSVSPDEIYNLAAQSHVKISFDMPHYTTQVDAVGTLNLLEIIRGSKKFVKLYQANTSEMYGGNKEDYTSEQWEHIQKNGMNESTCMFPKSPYGAAKLYAHNLIDIYRKSYGIFAVSGICFNHESERRDPRFVTRKVTRSVAMIYVGKIEQFALGNLDTERDWGYASDYVIAMHRMLQLETPEDFVISTGCTHTVRYLVEKAFDAVGIVITWKGEGVNEKGIDAKTGKCLVAIDERFYRPNEVYYLKGDSTKAKQLLEWEPTWTFEKMIDGMVKHDIREQLDDKNKTSKKVEE